MPPAELALALLTTSNTPARLDFQTIKRFSKASHSVRSNDRVVERVIRRVRLGWEIFPEIKPVRITFGRSHSLVCLFEDGKLTVN